MTTVLNGLIGGLLAAGVTLVAMRPFGTDSSAASAVVESVLGDRFAADGRVERLVQLLYGSLAGGALVAANLYLADALGVPPALAEALGVAAAWSFALFCVAVAVRRFVLGLPVYWPAIRSVLAFHLVYGIALGVWIRVTWIT